MTTIYGLKDPRDGTIRYVGRTINPKARLATHLTSRDARCGAARHEWIQELRAAGLLPVMVTLQVCDDDTAHIAEGAWIDRLKPTGLLTNRWPPYPTTRRLPRPPSTVHQLPFTESEWAAISAAARREGLIPSVYIRQAAIVKARAGSAR